MNGKNRFSRFRHRLQHPERLNWPSGVFLAKRYDVPYNSCSILR